MAAPTKNIQTRDSTDEPAHGLLGFSRLLRFWRGVHKVSQEALALRLDSSARHLSFLENGKTHPSKDMVEKISDELQLGSRDRSHLLVSAGYMPNNQSVDIQSPDMKWLRSAMTMTLKALDPYPSVLCDHQGNIVMANKSWVTFFQESLGVEQLTKVTNQFDFIFSRMGSTVLTEEWKDTLSVVLMSLTQNVLMGSGTMDDPVIKRLYNHPDLPTDWKQRAAKLEPMASYRVQLISKGQPKNFYCISQTVGAMGPTAYVSAPQLFISTLYPEDPSTDLSTPLKNSLSHPLLFY